MEQKVSELLLELYKSHHNAKEASSIVNQPYQNVANVYRGFKAMRVQKYDRVALIYQFSSNENIKGELRHVDSCAA
jgi:hypothetical protein